MLAIFSGNVLSATSIPNQLHKCEIMAINIHIQMIEAGVSHKVAFALSYAAEQNCYKMEQESSN